MMVMVEGLGDLDGAGIAPAGADDVAGVVDAPACVDCAHYQFEAVNRHQHPDAETHYCTRQWERDVVIGVTRCRRMLSCYQERGAAGSCGALGRHFESRRHDRYL